MKRPNRKLRLNPESIRVLHADLSTVAGGAVPTSKQPWCDDTLSAGCPK